MRIRNKNINELLKSLNKIYKRELKKFNIKSLNKNDFNKFFNFINFFDNNNIIILFNNNNNNILKKLLFISLILFLLKIL